MKYFLSVLVPGIHPEKWIELYDSIDSSFKNTWEIIFIGPYEPTKEVAELPNVKYIKDWGSPIRCQQMGLTEARGEYITWAADDGKYVPNSLNIAFDLLKNRYDLHSRMLVMGKYLEGQGNNGHMMEDDYYTLSRHRDSFSPWLPYHYLMLNVGIIPTSLIKSLGGWDCKFQACPMAYNDLAIRLQNYSCHFLVQDDIMFICSHSPLRTGDHGPIHDAQTDHDIPLFKSLYGRQECIDRIFIKLDNWKESPERWERRFGK